MEEASEPTRAIGVAVRAFRGNFKGAPRLDARGGLLAPRKEGRVRGWLSGRGGGIVVLVRGERTVAVVGGLTGGSLADGLVNRDAE